MVYFQADVKIVGGKPATAHSWPAHAYIKFCEIVGETMICDYCGGTLIDLTTIVTAGNKKKKQSFYSFNF